MYQDNAILFEKNIFAKPIEQLTKEELNSYILFCFCASNSISLQKEELRMYLKHNLIRFKREEKLDEDGYYPKYDENGEYIEEEDRKIKDIFFYVKGKKNSEICIQDYYTTNRSGYYFLKENAPTQEELDNLDIDEKINLIQRSLSYLSWDDDEECSNSSFTRMTRNAYRNLFSYEEIISILKSYDNLWEYIKDDIKELNTFASLKKYLEKESYVGKPPCIHKKDGTIVRFDNQVCIEIYSKKKRNDVKIMLKIKKAYQKGIIYLSLDDENIVGFCVKDLKNITTNENIDDIFSIDFFRYEAQGDLFETNDVKLVKSTYTIDEICEMIYDSIIVCFDDIRDSIFERIK